MKNEVKTMNFIDVLIIALGIGIVACVIHYQLSKKKNNNNGCGGSCGHCHFSDGCSSEKKED